MNEEISELEDSRAEPDRDAKARILAEQKARRKQEMLDKKRRDEAEAKKKRDNMDALTSLFRSEAAAFKKQMEAEKRSQERKERYESKHSRDKRKAPKS